MKNSEIFRSQGLADCAPEERESLKAALVRLLRAFRPAVRWLERPEGLENSIVVLPIVQKEVEVIPIKAGFKIRVRQGTAKVVRGIKKLWNGTPGVLAVFLNRVMDEYNERVPHAAISRMYHNIFGETNWGFIGFIVVLIHYYSWRSRNGKIAKLTRWQEAHRQAIEKILLSINHYDENGQKSGKDVRSYCEQTLTKLVRFTTNSLRWRTYR